MRFTFDLSIRACARPCRRANRTRVFQKTFASPSSFGYPQVPPRIFSSMARPRAPRADSRDACKSPLHRPPLTITTTATPRAWLLRREAEISADIAANQRFVPRTAPIANIVSLPARTLASFLKESVVTKKQIPQPPSVF